MGEICFGYLKKVAHDGRRTINEFNHPGTKGTPDDFSIQSFIIGPEKTGLGKHGHAIRFEIFIILEGSGSILTCPIDEKGNKLDEIIKTEVSAGDVIYIVPGTAHTFYLAEGTKMICHSSISFNPDEKDFVDCPWLVIENIHN